jgi:hypothetical protein
VSKPDTLETEAWPWPDSLDALVAAPAYHIKLVENDRVRVLHTVIPPGESCPAHPSLRRRGLPDQLERFHSPCQDGNVLADSRYLSPPQTVPCVQWTDPLPPHSVENVGGSVLRILMVKLKSTRVVGQPAVPENAGDAVRIALS